MTYIENLSVDPFFNLALEEYLFNQGEGELFMLWRSRPCVVCGCYQNVYAEVDLVRAAEMDVAVARRGSGGGTVFHDLGNINYTFIGDFGSGGVDYGRFIEPVALALRRMGVDARASRTSDIAINGLKISGSAQKVVKNRVLHHGTLLYDSDLTALRTLTRGRREKFSAMGIQSAPWPVTNIKAHLPAGAPDAAAFAGVLREELASDAPVARLTDAQLAEVSALAAQKYRSWNWTGAKSPAFKCEADFLWGGLPVRLCYEARRGIIESLSFDPLPPVLEEARRRLTGARLEIEAVRTRLAGLDGLENLYREFF